MHWIDVNKDADDDLGDNNDGDDDARARRPSARSTDPPPPRPSQKILPSLAADKTDPSFRDREIWSAQYQYNKTFQVKPLPSNAQFLKSAWNSVMWTLSIQVNSTL